jgi:hypothetical protein
MVMRPTVTGQLSYPEVFGFLVAAAEITHNLRNFATGSVESVSWIFPLTRIHGKSEETIGLGGFGLDRKLLDFVSGTWAA